MPDMQHLHGLGRYLVPMLRLQAEGKVKITRTKAAIPGERDKDMNFCKRSLCKNYKASKKFSGSRYLQGQKFCTICDVWLLWDGNHCPCCSHYLRKKARYGKSRQMIEVKRY